jgi:hypothetical protein
MADIRVEGRTENKVPPKGSKNTEQPPHIPTINELRFDAVQGIWQVLGMGCIAMHQYADAGAISMHSPAISREIVELAETNEQIAKGVDSLLQVGPFAGLIVAGMPLVMQLLVNHKRIPVDKLSADTGVISPELLESQVKTDMARMQLRALREQREAEQELARERAEWEAMQNDAA